MNKEETLSLAAQTGRQDRMKRLVEEVWRLERDLVSDGFDQALDRLGRELPMTVHSYPSGKEVWTWFVPKKWSWQEAYIERLNGERILDARNHPLHCARYSSSFEGVVRREELVAHLETHAMRPDAIPYGWRHYRNDWGLCCTKEFVEGLKEEAYRVVIRSKHEPGHLKVGEIVAQGSGDREFVLCAHLDHPAMANDDLTGVIVALEVMRVLRQRSDLRATYRLLLTPETIGSVAWLSSHEELIPRIAGGLFLEMLGTDCPHALQFSFQGDTRLDRLARETLQEMDPHFWHGPFRRVIGNDERQFNAPGVRVPMLSLSRVHPPSSGKWPYPEYHSSADTPAIVAWDRMERSVETVLALLERWEQDLYPVPCFRGEPFCTRYNLFVDFYKNQAGNIQLFDIIQRVDGTRSVSQIAAACGAPFSAVSDLVQQMAQKGLVILQSEPGRDVRPD